MHDGMEGEGMPMHDGMEGEGMPMHDGMEGEGHAPCMMGWRGRGRHYA